MYCGSFPSRSVHIVVTPPSQAISWVCDSLVVGAFTPLLSAVGGLLGPAFMPGFLPRPHAQSGRVAHATIKRRLAEPETNRVSIRPRRPVGAMDTAYLGRVKERCEGVSPCSSTGLIS